MKKYIVPQTTVYEVNNENDLMAGTNDAEASIVDKETTNVQLSKGSSSFSDEE